MATPTEYLLKGVMPELNRMTKEALKKEASMWRNLWSWIPSDCRYYFARVGCQVALTGRNYKRHMGTLLATHWDIKEIELGVRERVYDTGTGEYFWEDKIIRTKLGGLIDLQWITKRRTEAEFVAEIAAEQVPLEDSKE